MRAAVGPAGVELDEASRLALAYRAGQPGVLEALHSAVGRTVGVALGRYRPGRRVLPATLERADLAQESWVIVAELARRWRPELGSFGAYVKESLPWILAGRVRRESPSYRAKGVVMVRLEDPVVLARVEMAGMDEATRWAEELGWAEALARLGPEERYVLELHAIEEQPFDRIAARLGRSKSAVYRTYQRARRRLAAGELAVARPEKVKVVG